MPDPTTYEALWSALGRHLPAALDLRRRLHREPDLSGDEASTRDMVLAALPGAGAAVKAAETGAVLRIGGPGPAIGVRGEMDALPVTEDTDVAWASARPGVMHACGHDAHLAALVAVAGALAETGPPVPLLAVLQPREETYPSGARDIATSGVLDSEQCAAMVGVHVQPLLTPGEVACTPGGVNGSSDEFEIVVRGRSGHAAYPHLTNDALLAMSEIVVALQSVVSRSVDPMAPAVVGVSSFSAGNAANVIAGTARATGTVRALASSTRELIHRRITEVAESVARAHACTASVTITHGEPVLDNDPALVRSIAHELDRRGLSVSQNLRSLGSDDFSYFCERVPSAMLFVGTKTSEPLHSSRFLPDDADVHALATALMAGYLGTAAALEDHAGAPGAPGAPAG
ncbi:MULTISPECIES: M20 metallopeptidase family protein [unclassified Streptomyces]|uniref:M20 metallopeptidase family protein n=1 Tax=unclassified Streptomyces TaxID=2593676 RepID=UPI00093A770B|nr:M20 family metallopeptidase [Streptomyces sp. CB01580]OKJ25244.1 N-acyl-L-amino acid amidohydrolase [Streptomyces sp. CB01580]